MGNDTPRPESADPALRRAPRVRPAAALLPAILALAAACSAPAPDRGPLTPSAALDRYERRLLSRGDGSFVTCYVSRQAVEGPLPLLFFCQGGGYASMFVRDAAGDLYDRFEWFRTESAYGDRLRLAFVEKRGVRLGRTGEEEPSPAALAHDTLEERVEDTCRALKLLLEDPRTDRARVLLAGHGEGALVAALAAERTPGVTHLGWLAAGGLPRLFEMAWLRREELAAEGKEGADLEEGMDAFYEEVRRALEDPEDRKAIHFLRTSAHAATFWTPDPLAVLLRLEIPVFAAVAGLDPHVPAFSTDALRLGFLAAGKENLTFRVYPGLDHGFSVPPAEAGRPTEGEDAFHLPRVFDDLCAWFLAGP